MAAVRLPGFCLILLLAAGLPLLSTGGVASASSPAGFAAGGAPPGAVEASAPLDTILRYISDGWRSLNRSMDDCKTFADVKTNQQPVLYFPADFPVPDDLRDLPVRCHVRVAHLPRKIDSIGPDNFDTKQPDGLLYLQHPYVVPGGQFNEMYGWDSYFIIRGLLRDGQVDEAKGMIENFFFEIDHYGGVLNANRTYYLTRSQPPFLSSMVLAVSEAQSQNQKPDLAWVRRAYGYVVRDYGLWTRPPHLAGDTGLSRYFDFGEGPVPEIIGDPSHYYRGAAEYFLLHEGAASPELALAGGAPGSANPDDPGFPVYVCDPQTSEPDSGKCGPSERVALTSDFYKGDRSMRESGFDVSFRFGPFGAETHHYAPVCLNSLLYKTETDLEKMAELLGMTDEAQQWKARAAERRERITKYLWNGARGLYFDYDFNSGKQSSYEYATTFYPLWAGLASEEQARAVEQNLGIFEQPGGIAMSRRETKAQWDFPYGWAPVHLLAVEGLRRYGYAEDANRISSKFLSTVLQNFLRDGTIREKYDVAAKSSETHVAQGYKQNVIGFGWTNGVFLELLHELPPEYTSPWKSIADSGITFHAPIGVLADPDGHLTSRAGRAAGNEPIL